MCAKQQSRGILHQDRWGGNPSRSDQFRYCSRSTPPAPSYSPSPSPSPVRSTKGCRKTHTTSIRARRPIGCSSCHVTAPEQINGKMGVSSFASSYNVATSSSWQQYSWHQSTRVIGDWKCSRVDDGMSEADDSAADLLWRRVLSGLAMRRIQQLHFVKNNAFLNEQRSLCHLLRLLLEQKLLPGECSTHETV